LKKKKRQLCTLHGRKKRRRRKKDFQKQSDHHTPSCTISRGRSHDDASKKIAKDQVWPLGGVTYAPPKWHGHHPLIGSCWARFITFFDLKIKNTTLKYQNTPDDLSNYPKNWCKCTKIPPNINLIFCLI